MGKVVLIFIAAGMFYGVATIWSKWSERTSVAAPAPAVADREKPEGQDSGSVEKTLPARSWAQVSEPEVESEPVAAVASSEEWLLIEGWGFVRKGEELEDGAILEEWNHRRVVVRTDQGKETRRIRRPLEAVADLVTAVAASASAMAGSDYLDEKTER